MTLTRDQIAEVNPLCAANMARMGQESLTFQLGGMPSELREGLCEKFGPDEGMFTRCMDSSLGGWSPSDKAGFCAALHHACTGNWPAQSASRQSRNFATVEREIFAAGKWNGLTFDIDDLIGIAHAFHELKAVHKVPLKLGHNDDQPLKDGMFAIGWVEDVWVAMDSEKLMARFSDVPEVVFKAMQSKLYRNVSIELDGGVSHKNKRYDWVLSGVALLGAELPAVNTLADLQAYTHARLSAIRRMNFTLDDSEDKTMNAELEARLAAAEAKAKEAQAALEARLEADKRQAIKMAREGITKVLDDAVTSMRITPAQKTTLSRLLHIDDDVIVASLKVDDIRQLIEEQPQMHASAGARGAGTGTGSAGATAGERIDSDIKQMMAKEPSLNYTDAFKRVAFVNPELCREHFLDAGEDK
jgi:hypothetical protein